MLEKINRLEKNNKNILVFGDIMLDEYITGNVSRISPEAPIPVVNYEHTRYCLGGAANVAGNLVALDTNVTICSVIGNDRDGENLSNLLKEHRINTDLLLVTDERITTKKTRVMAENNQQLLRIDSEIKTELNQEFQTHLIKRLKEKIKQFDLILISDYLKGVVTHGVCQEIIKTANKYGINVLIDPKDLKVSKYANAFLLKPNKKELGEMTGQKLADFEDIKAAGINLKKELNNKYLLVTCGKNGMILIDEKNNTHLLDTVAKEVYDVTGAGDTVLSVLGCCLANGLEMLDAVYLSNIAAGIKVGKVGTATVSIQEIRGYLQPKFQEDDKLKNIEEIEYIAARHKERNQKIAFTNGCFDILHSGHIKYLREAAKTADILIVGLNSDSSIKRIKGPQRPINSQADRVAVLSALECVDYIVIFEEDTPYNLIKTIKPDFLIKGSDWVLEKVVGKDIVESYGGKVKLIDYVKDKSTTNTIEKVLKAYKETG